MSNSSPIKGYRPLDPRMIELANQNKLIEELVLRQVDKHKSDSEIDQRWVAIAITQIQQGFMSLNRSVFQPTRIEGEIDAIVLTEDLMLQGSAQ